MDLVPWHLHRSYLKTGWHCSNTYPPVLPSVRQQGPPNSGVHSPGAITVAPKELRPRSAGTRRAEALDPRAERVCRLLPLPQPRDISGAASAADGIFQESALASDAKLDAALRRPAPQETTAENLERLRLSDLSWLSGDLLGRMNPKMGELKELSLRGTGAKDDTIAALVAGSPKLESLDVSCCAVTKLDCITELYNLREFRAARCASATTPSFVGSLRCLGKLQVLDLSYSEGTTNEALGKLSDGVMRLKWLSLEACPNLADGGLLAVCAANPGLDHLSLALNVRNFSDDAASKAAVNFKRARFLDFSGCTQLARQLPNVVARQCEYLEELSFAGCPDLRDESVRKLLAGCHQLQRLDLAGCSKLTAQPFLEALPHCRALRRLNLTHIPAITDQAVAALYNVANGDAGDISKILAELATAAATAATEGGSEAGSDADSDGEVGAGPAPTDAKAHGSAAAAAAAAAASAAGNAQTARRAEVQRSQLIIHHFGTRQVDAMDLKDVIHLWRKSKAKKAKKGKKKGGKSKK
eukprot:TRINITY_DN72777_c0_g1_i1.p1 TRINITY_DN72777_c0_g1~~TRINITY_DN72777_c0_g1_i1.p1  ORF type:complete len:543 (-),score=108.76 TRINITY_DN72777_c0_g1_i1:28-1611(-)